MPDVSTIILYVRDPLISVRFYADLLTHTQHISVMILFN